MNIYYVHKKHSTLDYGLNGFICIAKDRKSAKNIIKIEAKDEEYPSWVNGFVVNAVLNMIEI